MKRILKDKLVVTTVGPDKNRDYVLFGPPHAKYSKNMKGCSIFELGTKDMCMAEARRLQERFLGWEIIDETPEISGVDDECL